MRILRFDSVGGASGDMILGALVGLGVDPRSLETTLKRLIPNDPFRFKIEEKSSFGVSGVHLTVELGSDLNASVNRCEYGSCSNHDHEHEHDHDHDHEHEHEHDHDHDHEHEHDHDHDHDHEHEHDHEHKHSHGRTYADIRALLENSDLDANSKRDALSAFHALACAEAEVHQRKIDDVHFHEVGAVDSIVDTVGCVVGLNALGVDAISLSPLPVGEGLFKCAHGVYPLPAPATAVLLRNYGLPVSYNVERCEMLTPTATSLFAIWRKMEIPSGSRVVASVNSFGTREMKTRPNILRATLYESSADSPYLEEELVELETNVDDASAERLATVASALFELGCLDVWFESIMMKKGRPGAKVCALLRMDTKSAALRVFFAHAGALGVRETVKRRYSLAREWREVVTQYGVARIKLGKDLTGATLVVAPEYDDCVQLAHNSGATFAEVYHAALAHYLTQSH